jgi:hypothetical protein
MLLKKVFLDSTGSNIFEKNEFDKSGDETFDSQEGFSDSCNPDSDSSNNNKSDSIKSSCDSSADSKFSESSNESSDDEKKITKGNSVKAPRNEEIQDSSNKVKSQKALRVLELKMQV